jgi:hypothetical protein
MRLAKATNRKFKLIVDKNTKVSSSLEELRDKKKIKILFKKLR